MRAPVEPRGVLLILLLTHLNYYHLESRFESSRLFPPSVGKKEICVYFETFSLRANYELSVTTWLVFSQSLLFSLPNLRRPPQHVVP